MKVVNIDPKDTKSLKNAEIELQILLEIKNPYIINLDSYFKALDKVYLIIDYCPNQDLLREMAEKKSEGLDFEEDEIWKYFIQASFGIEALHINGFIHRDIKPENILLDENKDVKLGDFGLSRNLEASSVIGTLPYYSPRMCKGEVPTKESDIWALGCVLYYLCNLEIPFNGNFGKIQNEPYIPIKSKYSEELKFFVDWCLKKERNERPTINEIITHEFIVEKAINLGIRIPKTSAMSIFIRNLLKEKKIKITEIEGLKAEIANISIEKNNYIETFRLKVIEIANFIEKLKTLNEKQLEEVKNSIIALIAHDYSKQDLKQETAQNAINAIEELKSPLNSSDNSQLINELSSVDPNDASTYNRIGDTFYNEKNYEEAVKSYNDAIKINPNCAAYYNSKGIALYELKRMDEAMECYQQAITIDPNQDIAYNGIGDVLYDDKNDYEGSLKYFNDAIRINPNSALYYKNKGVVLSDLKRKDEAMECFQQAINKFSINSPLKAIGLSS